MELTKEQLSKWRQQGLSNVQIANMTENKLSKVNNLFSRYKIKQRERGLSEATIEQICKMKNNGSSIEEIIAETGASRSSIIKYTKAAGISESHVMDLPETYQLAEKRRPRIFKTVINGKKYLDITELYIPR